MTFYYCTNSLSSLHILSHYCTFCASLHVKISPAFTTEGIDQIFIYAVVVYPFSFSKLIYSMRHTLIDVIFALCLEVLELILLTRGLIFREKLWLFCRHNVTMLIKYYFYNFFTILMSFDIKEKESVTKPVIWNSTTYLQWDNRLVFCICLNFIQVRSGSHAVPDNSVYIFYADGWITRRTNCHT